MSATETGYSEGNAYNYENPQQQYSYEDYEVPTDPEKLKEALVKQLEFIFSKEYLSFDPYFVSLLDSDYSLPITDVQKHLYVTHLTTDPVLFNEALRSSSKIVVCEEKGTARPANKLVERNTLILRDLPENATELDIRNLFSPDLVSYVKELKIEVANTCFIQFEDEDSALKGYNDLVTKTHPANNQPVKARIKSETLFKSWHYNTSPPYPPRLPYGNGTRSYNGTWYPNRQHYNPGFQKDSFQRGEGPKGKGSRYPGKGKRNFPRPSSGGRGSTGNSEISFIQRETKNPRRNNMKTKRNGNFSHAVGGSPQNYNKDRRASPQLAPSQWPSLSTEGAVERPVDLTAAFGKDVDRLTEESIPNQPETTNQTSINANSSWSGASISALVKKPPTAAQVEKNNRPYPQKPKAAPQPHPQTQPQENKETKPVNEFTKPKSKNNKKKQKHNNNAPRSPQQPQEPVEEQHVEAPQETETPEVQPTEVVEAPAEPVVVEEIKQEEDVPLEAPVTEPITEEEPPKSEVPEQKPKVEEPAQPQTQAQPQPQQQTQQQNAKKKRNKKKGPAKQEPVKEAPKVEPPKQDPPKQTEVPKPQEAPKQDPPKPVETETKKPEVPKAEPVKQPEAPKEEKQEPAKQQVASKAEPPKQTAQQGKKNQPKQNAPTKQETKQEQPKQETKPEPKQEQTKQEPKEVQPEPTPVKEEVVEKKEEPKEAPKQQQGQQGKGKQPAGKQQQGNQQQGKQQAKGNQQQGKQQGKGNQPQQKDAIKQEPENKDVTKTEPPKPEPTKTEPPKPEPTKTEPVKSEPAPSPAPIPSPTPVQEPPKDSTKVEEGHDKQEPKTDLAEILDLPKTGQKGQQAAGKKAPPKKPNQPQQQKAQNKPQGKIQQPAPKSNLSYAQIAKSNNQQN